MRELDSELIEVINGFLDAMDFNVVRNDKLIYLVDDNDNTQYVLRYSFMSNTITYRDILIKEIKQFFPVRYIEAEEILENWFSKKFRVIVDDMDMKCLLQMCYDMMDGNYDSYSDEELITEVKEYYPELLEE